MRTRLHVAVVLLLFVVRRQALASEGELTHLAHQGASHNHRQEQALESAQADTPPQQQQEAAWSVGPADLLVVFGTTLAGNHSELVKATRFWRKGVAAFIATNENVTDAELRARSHHNEVLIHFPDNSDGRTQYPGDTRAALAPLLAHRALRGQYKWMLYGDDDTLWFINGVVELARKMDPDLPYIVTDAGYWHHWNKPGFHARYFDDGPLQCLPCSFSSEAWFEAEGTAFTPPIGCPCTTKLLCEADKRGIMGEDCKMPEWFRMIDHIDGGAGALLSHGLLETMNASVYEACVTSGDGIASDYLFSYCMWQSGFAPVFPTFRTMPRDIDKRHLLFNPRGVLHTFHNPDRASIVTELLAAVERRTDACNDQCIDRLSSMVTLHLKSQHTASMQTGIFLLRSINLLYDSFLTTVNKGSLTTWPLVSYDKFKKPSPSWNRTDIPAITPARRKYDFGFVANPP